jgi:riboflavin kinase/FMN adenylyltransferase
MRVLRSLDELTTPVPAPALTIGNFDGVHAGHQRILASVVEAARAAGGTAVAMTFHPHPARVLGREAPPLLTTLEQRLRLLEEIGIEAALVLEFTRELSQLSPRAFVKEVLCGRLRMHTVCVGENFRFGHRQAGDVRLLEELSREFGFSMRTIPPVVVNGQVASSSLVRRLVAEGDVAAAADLLGRAFSLTGEVLPGAGRGHDLGFPTLNMQPEQECTPGQGVYITETAIEGKLHPSATNVGVRPTFEAGPVVVESHLLDYAGYPAGGELEVRFHERVRREQKFPSPEALRRQIAHDVEAAREFFAKRKERIEIGK